MSPLCPGSMPTVFPVRGVPAGTDGTTVVVVLVELLEVVVDGVVTDVGVSRRATLDGRRPELDPQAAVHDPTRPTTTTSPRIVRGRRFNNCFMLASPFGSRWDILSGPATSATTIQPSWPPRRRGFAAPYAGRHQELCTDRADRWKPERGAGTGHQTRLIAGPTRRSRRRLNRQTPW